MKSYAKALAHTVLSFLAMILPAYLSNNPQLNVTIGTLITLALNYLLSHYVPTTNGASAVQTLPINQS